MACKCGNKKYYDCGRSADEHEIAEMREAALNVISIWEDIDHTENDMGAAILSLKYRTEVKPRRTKKKGGK